MLLLFPAGGTSYSRARERTRLVYLKLHTAYQGRSKSPGLTAWHCPARLRFYESVFSTSCPWHHSPVFLWANALKPCCVPGNRGCAFWVCGLSCGLGAMVAALSGPAVAPGAGRRLRATDGKLECSSNCLLSRTRPPPPSLLAYSTSQGHVVVPPAAGDPGAVPVRSGLWSELRITI